MTQIVRDRPWWVREAAERKLFLAKHRAHWAEKAMARIEKSKKTIAQKRRISDVLAEVRREIAESDGQP